MPEKLYRGIVIPYDLFKKYDFTCDMTPPNPYQLDEYGRKTVRDGNEYGVYMTDNYTMVSCVYANPSRPSDTIVGEKTITDSSNGVKVNALPLIGIIYEIESYQLNGLREPWITPQLRGHYNNGFEGKEYIADVIPSDKYKIYSVQVGEDLWHPEQTLSDFSSIVDLKNQVQTIMEQRTQDLEYVVKFCECHTQREINDLVNCRYMSAFQHLFDHKSSFPIEELDLMKMEHALVARFYLGMVNDQYLTLSTEDIRNVLLHDPNATLKKISFGNDSGKHSTFYIDEKDGNVFLLGREGTMVDKHSFVPFSKKQIEDKMIANYAEQMKTKLSDDERERIIEEYKTTDEYDPDFQDFIEDEAYTYYAKKKIHQMEPSVRNKKYDDLIRNMNRIKISQKDHTHSYIMVMPDGREIRGKTEVIFSREQEGSLNKVDEILTNNRKKHAYERKSFPLCSLEIQCDEELKKVKNEVDNL